MSTENTQDSKQPAIPPLSSSDLLALAEQRLKNIHPTSIRRGVAAYLCNCSCADKCPLGKAGSETRCTLAELHDFIKANDQSSPTAPATVSERKGNE